MSHIRVEADKVPCLPGMSPLGFPIFIQEFEVIYIYGGTAEIKAQLAWKQDVCVLILRLDTLLTNFSLFYRAWRSGTHPLSR